MATALASLQALETLWINSGGAAAFAPDAAAIADAESGLNPNANVADPNANDPNARSYGLFQLNTPNLAPAGLTPVTALDPTLNTKAAVALFANGSGINNWSSWTSYLLWKANPNAGLTTGQAAAAATINTDLATIGGTTPALTSQPGGLFAGLKALINGQGLAAANTAATTANAKITATQSAATTGIANIIAPASTTGIFTPFGMGVLAVVVVCFVLAFLLSSGGGTTSVTIASGKATS